MAERDKIAARRVEKARQQQLSELNELQRRELDRLGVTARIDAVGKVLSESPFFYRSIQREIRIREVRDGKFKTLDPIRGMALRILAVDFKCDMNGVDIHASWDPKTHVLTYRAVPSIPMLFKANEAAMEAMRAAGRQPHRLQNANASSGLLRSFVDKGGAAK